MWHWAEPCHWRLSVACALFFSRITLCKRVLFKTLSRPCKWLDFPYDNTLHIITRLLESTSQLWQWVTSQTSFSSPVLDSKALDLGVFRNTAPESTRKRSSKVANVFHRIVNDNKFNKNRKRGISPTHLRQKHPHPWVSTTVETNFPSIRFRTILRATSNNRWRKLVPYSVGFSGVQGTRDKTLGDRDRTCTSTLLNETTLQGTKLDYASQILPWLYLNIWVAVGECWPPSGGKRTPVRRHS